jgi:hypothetical protein
VDFGDFEFRLSKWIFQAGDTLGLIRHQLDQEAAQSLFLGSSKLGEAQAGEETPNGADGRHLHPNLNFTSGHLEFEFQGRILGQLHFGLQPTAAHSDIGYDTFAVFLSI